MALDIVILLCNKKPRWDEPRLVGEVQMSMGNSDLLYYVTKYNNFVTIGQR